MAQPVNVKNLQREQRSYQQRILIATALVLVAALTLGGRLFLLQVVRHSYYLELSQGNRARLEPIPANRGLILDRNGRVLAENQAAYQLELIREQVPVEALRDGLAFGRGFARLAEAA